MASFVMIEFFLLAKSERIVTLEAYSCSTFAYWYDFEFKIDLLITQIIRVNSHWLSDLSVI